MKSPNGTRPPKNVKEKSYQPLGRVVRKEKVEKSKHIPRGRVIRKNKKDWQSLIFCYNTKTISETPLRNYIMQNIWFILIVMLTPNAEVKSDLRYPVTPDVNNELACNKNGPDVAAQYIKEHPTYRVFWQCHGVSVTELAKGIQ